MPSELSIEEQTEIVRDLLTQTQAGKAMWENAGEPGAYRSVRPRAVAVLDAVGTPPRVRLRFSAVGRDDFDTVIEQVLADAAPFPEEQQLDAYLAMLRQLVHDRSPRRMTSARLFLEDGEG